MNLNRNQTTTPGADAVAGFGASAPFVAELAEVRRELARFGQVEDTAATAALGEALGAYWQRCLKAALEPAVQAVVDLVYAPDGAEYAELLDSAEAEAEHAECGVHCQSGEPAADAPGDDHAGATERDRRGPSRRGRRGARGRRGSG